MRPLRISSTASSTVENGDFMVSVMSYVRFGDTRNIAQRNEAKEVEKGKDVAGRRCERVQAKVEESAREGGLPPGTFRKSGKQRTYEKKSGKE